MPEAEIIYRIDEEQLTFSAVVESYGTMVYNTCLGILQQAEDAEEATQDTFVKLYQKLDTFENRSTVKTWLYRIAVNTALDMQKAMNAKSRGGFLKRIFGEKDEPELTTFDHPGVVLDRKEDASLLFKAMNKLPENQKIAFMLQKLEGLTALEIAPVMEMSPTAVESLLARAKENLKKILSNLF